MLRSPSNVTNHLFMMEEPVSAVRHRLSICHFQSLWDLETRCSLPRSHRAEESLFHPVGPWQRVARCCRQQTRATLPAQGTSSLSWESKKGSRQGTGWHLAVVGSWQMAAALPLPGRRGAPVGRYWWSGLARSCRAKPSPALCPVPGTLVTDGPCPLQLLCCTFYFQHLPFLPRFSPSHICV